MATLASAPVALADLMARAKSLSFETYSDRFTDLNIDANELTFGPMDWLEADVWSSVIGSLQLYSPTSGELLSTPPGSSSFTSEIDAVLKARLSLSDLCGYKLSGVVPKSIRARSLLWRPDLDPNTLDVPWNKTWQRFTNSDGEQWADFHQTVSMFWSRQTYRVDLSAYDWLAKTFENLSEQHKKYPNAGHMPEDLPKGPTLPNNLQFVDEYLGPLEAFAKKWRPFEGSVFGVDGKFARSAWLREFKSIAGETVDKGGAPKKSHKFVNKYFELYPKTHSNASASPEGRVSWKVALNAVIDALDGEIAESTFKREIRKDPRFKPQKK